MALNPQALDTPRGNWLEAQYSVLGSVLICPELIPKVMNETTEQDFEMPCLAVYRAIRDAFEKDISVDPVIIAANLDASYRSFVLDLMEITPTAANIDRYIALCKEQSKIVSLRRLAEEMSTEQDGEKMREMVERANGMLARKPGLKIITMADALQSFMTRKTQKPNYLTWPVKELNDRLYVEPGAFVVIGGYPSTGKSAWALQCAWHWAQTKKVGFFSLETSSEILFDRQVAAAARISMDTIKRNNLSQDEWDRVCGMTDVITSRKLELIPAAGMSPADIRAVTMMQGYEIILVDYLQLIQGSGENRVAQVTNISIALHTMAQSMGVTVVALSQLARQDPKNKNAAPDMSALRESGQIEQDADVIMMLSLEDKEKPEGPRELRIRKNKEGTRPNILLGFDGKHQTFYKIGALQKTVEDVARIKGNIKPAKAPYPPKEEPQKTVAGQMTILPDDTEIPF